MLLPWGTDAPIYHWPIATVGLIVVNTVAYIGFSSLDLEQQHALCNSLGHGIHPLEWFTSVFCHVNAEHLIGNMIFLWAFGIVVEGKLGWWRFLLVYVGIGVVQSAIEQVVFLGKAEPSFSLGASAAIYGLLAICLVWAPRNDLNCLSFFRFVPVPWDVSILFFAMLYIGLEVLLAVGSAGRAFSAVAHSSGAVIGFAVGVAMLQWGLVDCENWDLFTVLRGRHIKPIGGHRKGASFAPSPSERAIKKKKKAKTADQGESLEDPSSAATRKLRFAIENKDVDTAILAFEKGMRTVPGWRLPEPDYRDLIKLLIADKQWRPVIHVIETYIKRIDNPQPSIRVTLAQILAYEVERPAHALRILSEIPKDSLSTNLEAQYRKVVRKAEAMREEGVLELEGDSW